ncbi:MAG: GNAT family N-acetyltransferase [Actinomycetota bacterium]|nr:GNAT family N-acetyltransferase [Actinomycetota bacterium]
MLRLLTQNDHRATVAFLDRDHETNLIMIYDIENYGMDNRGHIFQGYYYGAFRGSELLGVACLFNFGSMFAHSREEGALMDLARHIFSLGGRPRYLHLRSEWMPGVLAKLAHRGIKPTRVEEQEYLMLSRDSFRPRSEERARPARPEDLPTLFRLHRAFQEEYFGTYTETEEEMGRMAEERISDTGVAVAEAGGAVVSKAEVLVRTWRMALIGGVYTEPEYRGKGLSQACISRICRGILDEREKACLNVARNNPPAISVYRGVGFEYLCDYSMALFDSRG